MAVVQIGKITKPQGVRGEFRLRPFADDYSNYVEITKVTIGVTEYTVNHISLRNGFVVVKVNGINDRNVVETLVGATVSADMPEEQLDEGEYFIKDVIGCSVVDESGNNLGRVTAINNYGAADVYTVKGDTGEFMFPKARDVITSIDVDAKVVTVNSVILSEMISE